mmetsp:Transcript_20506/g.56859  ORF Transcript_20506/g.56859 Transcript_20506/m.56859 type:complete len:850 (+) Transcript_20506:389-2938(+)
MSDAKILQYKNQKLREQVEVHKREKAALEERIAALQGKQSSYEDNLLCINRLWGELNRGIAILASRADPAVSAVPGPRDDDLDSKALASAPDPFLQRLVRGTSWAEKQYQESLQNSADGTSNNLERDIRMKCQATKAALCKVLDQIDTVQAQRMDAIAKAIEGSAGVELEELREKLVSTQKELDGFRGWTLATESRQAALQDDLLKAEKEVMNLSNELADKQEDVSILQRKLMNARAKAEEEERAHANAAASTSGTAGDKSSASASGAAQGEDGDLTLSLAEEHKRLEKRTTELEEERKLSRQLRLDLREAKLALQDETRFLNSKLHQDMVSRFNILSNDLARQREGNIQMRRDLELAMMREHELKFKAGEADKLERTCHILEARARDLEIQKNAAAKARDDAHARLQVLHEQVGKADTVGQLKVMVATLQKEISMLQANNSKLKAAGDQLQTALADAESQRTAREALEAEKAALTSKLNDVEAEQKKTMHMKVSLEEKAEDLKVFVEVLQSVVSFPKDVADLLKRAERAEGKVASLQKQLEQSALTAEIKRVEGKAKAAEQALEAKEQGRVALELKCSSLERQLKELRDQLQNQKAELEAYIQEIDVIGSAYEDMQAQNTALLQQMTERDALTHSLQSERLQLDQQAANLKEEKQNCESKVTVAESKAEALQAREADLRGHAAKLADELAQTHQKVQEITTQLEEAMRKVKEKEGIIAEKQMLIDAAQKYRTDSQRLANETGERLEGERLKRQRAEEELKLAAGRIERLKRKDDAAGANKELEGEVDDMRTLLRCSVCHERQKNVIITKCYHMFCKVCIQRNLDTRHRKCPGCGVGFGAQDVKNVFFT